MSLPLSRCLCRVLSRQKPAPGFVSGELHPAVGLGLWFGSVMTLKTSAPLWGEPLKKKKVDPKRDQLLRDRLKKKVKRLEKSAPELIPIEDFVTATKSLDETRVRSTQTLSFEESEARALLLKEWGQYKQKQHFDEVKAVELALEAQEEALEELKLESMELYKAALTPDRQLFPFTHNGPAYTPPNTKYEAPYGKYNITNAE